MKDNKNEESKYVYLKDMLDSFQDLVSYADIEDETSNTVFEIIETPKRSDIAYIALEGMDEDKFTSYIIFLMAIRNKEVKEIVSKIKYIFDYIANDNLLINNKHMKEHNVKINYEQGELEYDYFSFMIIDMEFERNLSENQKNLKEKYISTGLKELEELKEDLKFLADENETTDLYFENLCAIVENLFNILKEKFLIYPYGYRSNSSLEDIYEFIENREQASCYYSKDKRINLYNFKKLLNKGNILIADLFFMYDYNNYSINQSDKADTKYINKKIKCSLTKHHGISKKGTSTQIPYKEFIENYNNYENYKGADFGYYITERSLRSKIAMMQKFIDECGYRDLFFI